MARAGVTVCVAALWYQHEERRNRTVEGTAASEESLHEPVWGEFPPPGLQSNVPKSKKKKKKSDNQQFKHY